MTEATGRGSSGDANAGATTREYATLQQNCFVYCRALNFCWLAIPCCLLVSPALVMSELPGWVTFGVPFFVITVILFLLPGQVIPRLNGASPAEVELLALRGVAPRSAAQAMLDNQAERSPKTFTRAALWSIAFGTGWFGFLWAFKVLLKVVLIHFAG